MNKMTQDLVSQINMMVELNQNISVLTKKYPDKQEKLELIKSYIEYEIKRNIDDIVLTERL